MGLGKDVSSHVCVLDVSADFKLLKVMVLKLFSVIKFAAFILFFDSRVCNWKI